MFHNSFIIQEEQNTYVSISLVYGLLYVYTQNIVDPDFKPEHFRVTFCFSDSIFIYH